jgi:acyl-ACP thioesterase
MDKTYHMRPMAAVMFFQDCFAQFMTTKNIAAFDLVKENIYWVIAGFDLEFVKETPFWSEQIKVEVWVSELTKMKMFTDFVFYHNNEVFAKGNACWFILDMNSKRPLPMNKISDKIEIIPELVLGEHSKYSVEDWVETVAEVKYTTNINDIDFNNHVSNKSYINLAQSTIGADFRSKHGLKKLTVKFCKETFIYDKLECKTYKGSDNLTYIHKILKDSADVCDIKTVWADDVKNSNIENYKLAIRN